MNIKKSHEVKEMASFAAKLALIHEVQKVVDIGSGKGYLGQYLSLQCGLDVIGIDSSDSNTHGAIDRNCKLQKNWQGISRHSMNAQQNCSQLENPIEAFKEKFTTKTHKLKEIQKFVKCSDKMSDTSLKIDRCRSQALVNMHESNSQSEGSEVSASHMVNWSRISQSESAFDDVHQRLMNIQQSDSQSPATLTSNEASDISHEMRISKHLQMIDLFSDDDCPAEVNKPKCGYNQTNHNSDSDKKENNPATQEGWNSSSNNSPCHGNGNATMNGSRFYPVTAFVEPSTTLTSMVSQNVEEAEQDKEIPFMLVGLHTCGDLAPSTLRLFVHNDTARVLLNVGCCYQRLSEEFETEGWTILETKPELCGFPMSHFLRSKGTKINRPARMLASMAADRIATSQIVPAMGLFYRSVLQVLLQDHYRLPTRSENVGKLAPKCRSFLEYARKALKKLQFDDSKLSDAEICTYAERFQPYYYQLQALNQLRVALAPTIEGLFLLDRLCYLQEQTSIHSAALVRLFDPVTSPRCYAILATR